VLSTTKAPLIAANISTTITFKRMKTSGIQQVERNRCKHSPRFGVFVTILFITRGSCLIQRTERPLVTAGLNINVADHFAAISSNGRLNFYTKWSTLASCYKGMMLRQSGTAEVKLSNWVTNPVSFTLRDDLVATTK